jgi:tRNA (guanine-N7-)-methyltransferase
MSSAQKKSYESGVSFLVPYSDKLVDFSRCFGNTFPVTVEIGFGMGKATAEIAAANTNHNYLGIEVFKAGIGKLLWEIEQRSLSNIRIIEHDAVEVVEKMIPPSSVAAFHIFFPDPWPKKRHHKRRLIQLPFAELLASRLVDGGYIYMVSDWEDYVQEALGIFSQIPRLFNPHNGNFAPGQSWRPRTKFEQKGLAEKRLIKEIYVMANPAAER